MNKKQWMQIFGFTLIRTCMVITAFIIIFIIYDLVSKGSGVITWEFLTTEPTDSMTKGGIWPAIVGTILVTIMTAIVTIPLGVACAIYLNEYSKDTLLTRIIRTSIRNLAGVPSIVYGLFGALVFVRYTSPIIEGIFSGMYNLTGWELFFLRKFDTCLFSAGMTLGILSLPWTISASEEALKAVPDSFRQGSFALGATKWQMIRTSVLPYASPGILTGIILSLSRAAGETAPILFTGVAFYLPSYVPELGDIFSMSFSQFISVISDVEGLLVFGKDLVVNQFMALPYHLYIMSTQHHDINLVRPIAYGTALVLVVLVFTMNLIAVIFRYRLRRLNKE